MDGKPGVLQFLILKNSDRTGCGTLNWTGVCWGLLEPQAHHKERKHDSSGSSSMGEKRKKTHTAPCSVPPKEVRKNLKTPLKLSPRPLGSLKGQGIPQQDAPHSTSHHHQALFAWFVYLVPYIQLQKNYKEHQKIKNTHTHTLWRDRARSEQTCGKGLESSVCHLKQKWKLLSKEAPDSKMSFYIRQMENLSLEFKS